MAPNLKDLWSIKSWALKLPNSLDWTVSYLRRGNGWIWRSTGRHLHLMLIAAPMKADCEKLSRNYVLTD